MGELPVTVLSRVMFKSGNEMNGVFANLIRCHLWLEVKRTKTTVATSGRVQLWIDIENALCCHINYAQIRIAGALDFAIGGTRKVAAETGCSIQQFAQCIFDVAADLVDSFCLLYRVIGDVQSPNRFVQRRADLF